MRRVELSVSTRLLNPSPVLMLCTRARQRANVMALSRYCVVSQSPPRVAISLVPSRYSLRLLRESGDFNLCIPEVTSLEEVHFCGMYSGRYLDKIQLRDLPTTRAMMTTPLLVTNCIGHLECEVCDVLHIGDLVTVVGEIISALVDEEYWDQRWMPDAHLLFHLGGDQYLVGEQVLRPRKLREPRFAIDPPPELDDPWQPRVPGSNGRQWGTPSAPCGADW